VIFSADPIEMHGDPRYQPYAHAFYHALCESLQLSGEKVEPPQAPVHCFRVPSQDGREITLLVNHSEKDAVRDMVVSSRAGDVTLSLNARLSGAIVAGKDNRVQAVESSGDVQVNRALLIGSDLHFMAISMNEKPLASSRALLLLPMGEGQLRLPGANRWHQPVVLVGEVAGEHWKQYESFHPEQDGDTLKLPIHAVRNLSMMILCEATDQTAQVKQMEAWVKQPWTLAS
jgi:hypothetical protein